MVLPVMALPVYTVPEAGLRQDMALLEYMVPEVGHHQDMAVFLEIHSHSVSRKRHENSKFVKLNFQGGIARKLVSPCFSSPLAGEFLALANSNCSWMKSP
jgi:hypothetical protein